jgi:GGDEF domain-containing protein
LVLKEVTEIFGSNLRNADILPAWRETSLVLFCHRRHLRRGSVVEKLRSKLESTAISLMVDQITLTASFGIAEYPEQGRT